MINKELVSQHFGKNAGTYDTYAVVQKAMGHTLGELVKKQGTFESILEIGCGTGYFTQILATLFPQAQIVATDISPAMLETAKKKLCNYPNICYKVEDGENLQLKESFQLVVSNAVFQWFSDYRQAFIAINNRLMPGGCLAYATFGEDTFCELHRSFAAARSVLGLEQPSCHGPQFISLEELRAIGRELDFFMDGFEERVQEYFPTVADFLTSVKKIGANNAASSERMTVNRKLLMSMMESYEKTYRKQQQIPATYHIIYGMHKKSNLLSRIS